MKTGNISFGVKNDGERKRDVTELLDYYLKKKFPIVT